MQVLPLSVFILTKNEEIRIEKTLKALVGWTDEIIVVDCGSIDGTVEIAKKYNCKVVFHEFEGFGQQKVYGQSLCKNKWILNIDADEVVTDELKEEIIQLFNSGHLEDYFAYKFKIVNTFRFEEKPKKLAYYYNQTRLYNVEKAGFRASTTHDSVIIEGVKEHSSEENKLVGKLNGIAQHYFIISFGQWIDKLNRYSELQARESYAEGKRIKKIAIFFAAPFHFFKAYFLRRYFIYGVDGFIYSKIYSNARFYKYARMKELRDEEKYNRPSA